MTEDRDRGETCVPAHSRSPSDACLPGRESLQSYFRFQVDAAESSYRWFQLDRLLRKGRVLDLGCGLGGKLYHLARTCPGIAPVGADIDEPSLRTARRLLLEEGGGLKIPLARIPEDRLPFADGSFDSILSVDVIEHMSEPQGVLREAFRVTRPGGHLFLGSGPLYYSPWGGHLYDVLRIPWGHLILPERAIDRRIEAHGDSPVATRAELRGQWRSLNRITSREVQACVRGAGYHLKRIWVLIPRRLRWLASITPFAHYLEMSVWIHARRPGR